MGACDRKADETTVNKTDINCGTLHIGLRQQLRASPHSGHGRMQKDFEYMCSAAPLDALMNGTFQHDLILAKLTGAS